MNNTMCSGHGCTFDCNRTAIHLLHHINEKIPTKITYSDIDILPRRENFLSQATLRAFKKQVDAAKPVIFMPTTVVEKNDWRDDRLKYLIYLFGVLPCGSKTCVILSNIEVHVDVMVPDDMSADDFENVLRGHLVERNLTFTCINTIMAFRLHNFQKQKRPYKRIVFDTLQERKKVIDFISRHNKDLKSANKAKLETAADDLSRDNYYFPKVAREFKFATADWNRIEKYKVLSPALTTNCTYVLGVDVRDFKKVSKSRREEYLAPDHFLAPVIDRDPTMVGMWDIETHRTIQNGLVPTPSDIDFTIFMICSAYFQHYSEDALAEFCVVDQESNARNGISLVIVCGNEVNVVTAHMEIVGRMCPDIMGAFNGGNFDWPLYREKCRRFKLLTKLKSKFSSLPPYKSGRYTDTEESVEKWCFTFKNIKIDAETTHKLSCVATFPGILDTDVMPVFLKMYPRAEVRKSASLNFFLAKNGLEAKEDMPYKRMFKIYERACKLVQMKSCHCGDAQSHCATCSEIIKELDCKPRPGSRNMESTEYSDELHDDLVNESGRQLCCWCGKRPRSQRDMADVGYYCVIDCIRPQQLYVKRTIIPDKRELSTMSYVSLADSFYRADGMKVCNVIGAYCFKYGIAFSNAASDKESHDKDHFPGGWVFPPRRGLHSDNFIDVDVIGPDGTMHKKQIRARPITGLDFASLYPSLMMAYNLSPDMIVNTKAEADALLAEGYTLHHIQPFNYERGAKKGNVGNKQCTIEGWTVRHNGIFNPKTDKNIAAKYVKYEKIEYVVDGKLQNIKYPAHVGCDATQAATLASLRDAGVKTTRRVTYEPEAGRPALVGERMGIFSFIVKKIFDKRVPIKAEFVRLTKLKEEMEHKGLGQITIATKGVDRILSFEDVSFMLNKVESKQKALKILANTFYGKSGDYRASIYSLLVAAGITCAGQENIKRVAQFVSGLGFISQYGDTDSLYLSCPDDVFAECDREYNDKMSALRSEFEGIDAAAEPDPKDSQAVEYKARRTALRVAWWEKQVKITMNLMNNLKEQVSDFLLANNGTLFLNMAYEEVGYPTVLCGKKKYYLTPHVATINFYPKDYFIRGIDIIKQGQAPISRQLGDEYIKKSLSPENERELIDLAGAQIRKFYSMEIKPTSFVLSAKYRPDKKNIPVLSFVKRMKEMRELNKANPLMAALYEPPEPGDKFEYVIVKKHQTYTLQGNKIEIKKGDQMEYLRVYLASQGTTNPMEIDLDYYMKNAVVGIFARFIAYHPQFQPPEGMFDITNKDQYKELDQYCISGATKYLESICDSITGFDRGAINKVGRDYRAIYHRANKQLRRDLTSRYGGASMILHDINLHVEDGKGNRVVDQLKELARSWANISDENTFGVQYIHFNNQRGHIPLFDLRRIYNGTKGPSVTKIRVQLCDRKERQLEDSLYRLVSKLTSIVYHYERGVINLIEDMRKVKYEDDVIIEADELEYINAFNAEDAKVILDVYDIIRQLGSIYRLRADTLSIAQAIENECAGVTKITIQPRIDVPTIAQREADRAAVVPEYNWQ